MFKNLIANYLGQAWSALMALAFIPIYIKYLGVEAYGLIGLFSVLQACLSLLDMGMSPAFTREMAKFIAIKNSSSVIRNLLRSIELILLFVAFISIAITYFLSEWIATKWLSSELISTKDVQEAILIMSFVIAVRLIENLYRSSISGMHRQVLLNIVGSFIATLRGFGAVIVLALCSPTISAFFIWQATVSAISVVCFAVIVYKVMPNDGNHGKFSLSAVKDIKNYAGGVLAISILSLMLTQLDKIILSNLLTLHDFGLYTLASVVAGALYTLVSPITQVWFPKLTELYTLGKNKELINNFHFGAQLVSVLAGSASLVLIFQGEIFLQLWTQNYELSNKVYPLLSVISVGYLINIIMWIPFETQLAHGSVTLPVKINIAALLIMIPLVLTLTQMYGALGSAWAWLLLNIFYFVIGIHFMFKKVLPTEKWSWYINDVFIPLFPPILLNILIKCFFENNDESLYQVGVLLFSIIITLLSSSISASHIRNRLIKIAQKKLNSN